MCGKQASPRTPSERGRCLGPGQRHLDKGRQAARGWGMGARRARRAGRGVPACKGERGGRPGCPENWGGGSRSSWDPGCGVGRRGTGPQRWALWGEPGARPLAARAGRGPAQGARVRSCCSPLDASKARASEQTQEDLGRGRARRAREVAWAVCSGLTSGSGLPSAALVGSGVRRGGHRWPSAWNGDPPFGRWLIGAAGL